jgi:transposase-like protein
MRSMVFDELFATLVNLPLGIDDLFRLRHWLASIAHPGECLSLIEGVACTPPCPHCACSRVHRCGQASGLQRFRCCRCRRSYNALTGTPLARLRRKEKWLPYLQCLLESRTVRDAARVTGVHRTTSFRWRHRFLPGAMHERPAQLSAIVEADETYLLESQKGSRQLNRPPRKRGGVARRRGINRDHDCLLVARDRGGRTLDFHTGRGPVTASQLARCLGPVLASDVLLISDAALAYRTFAAKAGLSHEIVNVKAGICARGALHIQNVNGWHSRFKTWLLRFRGVASRYLVHYSGWQRILDDARLTTPALLLRTALRCRQSAGTLHN